MSEYGESKRRMTLTPHQLRRVQAADLVQDGMAECAEAMGAFMGGLNKISMGVHELAWAEVNRELQPGENEIVTIDPNTHVASIEVIPADAHATAETPQ